LFSENWLKCTFAVFPEPRRELVLGFSTACRRHGRSSAHAAAEAMVNRREYIPSLPIDRWTGYQGPGLDAFWRMEHALVALPPSRRLRTTTIGHSRAPPRQLVRAGGAHIDRARLAVGILLEANDFGHSRQRVARKHRLQEPAIGIAQIGNGIERDIRHRLAEDDVEREQVIDWRLGVANGFCEGIR
jgi:hypothetical protein